MGLNIKDKKILICDTEANGLSPNKVWCVCTTDFKTGLKEQFDPDGLKDFKKYAKEFDTYVGHNIIGYDRPKVLNRLLSLDIKLSQCIDTLTMSRLSNPSKMVMNPVTKKIISGHSLEAWGMVLGLHKVEHEDWSQYTYDMLMRCRTDTDINVLVFNQLLDELKDFSNFSIMMEHRVADEIRQMTEQGVYFNVKEASILRAELYQKSEEIRQEVLEEFPPRPIADRVIEPQYNRNGTLGMAQWRWYSNDREVINKEIGGPVTRFYWEEFNLGSHKQVVSRMNEIGWQPIERTVGAQQAFRDFKQKKISKEKLDKILELGWKVSETNLETIPEDAPPGARKLREWKMLDSRVSTLDSWLDCVNPLTGHIHGYVNPIGAVTTRMTHDSPNTANIVASHKPDGKQIRGLWGIDPEELKMYCMLGEDADAIQMRLFAHEINDYELIKAIEEGRKEDGTDPHTLHSKLLNHSSRETSKTWFYAFLFDALPPKLASVSGRDVNEETFYYGKFLDRYPQIDELKERLAREYKSHGSIKGLDGRWLKVRERPGRKPPFMNIKIQGNEAVVMKLFLILRRNAAIKEQLEHRLLLNVHDELQWRLLREQAPRFGELGYTAMDEVAARFKLNIKLKVNYTIGDNWAQTH